MHRLKLSFKVRKLDIFLVCISILLILISYNLFYNYVIHFLNVIYGKLVFLNNDSLSDSASSRIDRWVFVVEYFLILICIICFLDMDQVESQVV